MAVPPSEMDDLLKEFLVESHENLDRLDRELLVLEKNPAAKEALAGIFRTIHTLKGTCGFLGFARLEAVAHAGETLLSRLRDGELALTGEMMNALLAMVDAVREILGVVEATGAEGDADYGALVSILQRLQNPTAPPAPVVAPAAAPVPAPAPASASAPISAPVAPAAPAPHPPASARADPPAPASAAEPGEARASVSDAYVRVDVNLLDKLMNLVGELVLARNQVLQFVPAALDQAFTATSQRLNLITSELQSGVMKTRMQPIGNVWERFPRLVRDLALQCGKEARVEMEGKETELDKTIIEAIKDPLTHLVRNSVDHGIESREDRLARGKRSEGKLSLRAFHEGGQVNIEISDDGGGLDVDRIRAKALERGLITAEQAARMSDRELHALIFLPGFSTATRVSHISGRGVGMDVVKTNIEKIGGAVDVVSHRGEGSTFRIKIPLTLAIIPALIVSTGGERYAIPQVNLLELVRVKGDERHTKIENLGGTPVYRLRGRLLPLVSLAAELALDDRGGLGSAGGAVNIVVVQADGLRFGLIVDQINDTEEIVVKPLGQHLKGIAAFAGATIMGDGRVALILDVMGLCRSVGLGAEARGALGTAEELAAVGAEAEAQARARARRQLLIVQSGDDRLLALPLASISRLEVFPRKAVERVGARAVVQYRGEVLPLHDAGALLGGAPVVDSESIAVVVHAAAPGAGEVGLVVQRIVDVIEEAVEVKPPLSDRGPAVIGCLVLQGQVAELIDVGALLGSSSAGGAAPHPMLAEAS